MTDDGPVGAGAQIDVDPAALREFAGAVRGELEGSLRGQVFDGFGAYARGAGFGRGWCGSAVVRGAQGDYASCLEATTRVLAGYVDLTAAFVAAAEQVAANYDQSDAWATASAKDVDAALSQAYSTIVAVGMSETRREQFRGTR